MGQPHKFKITFTLDLWRKVETTTILVNDFWPAVEMADKFVKENKEKYNVENGYHMEGCRAHMNGWNYDVFSWQDRFDNLISAKVEPYC